MHGRKPSTILTDGLRALGTNDGVGSALLQIQTSLDHQPSQLQPATTLALICSLMPRTQALLISNTNPPQIQAAHHHSG
jgi:hypothetical protein